VENNIDSVLDTLEEEGIYGVKIGDE